MPKINNKVLTEQYRHKIVNNQLKPEDRRFLNHEGEEKDSPFANVEARANFAIVLGSLLNVDQLHKFNYSLILQEIEDCKPEMFTGQSTISKYLLAVERCNLDNLNNSQASQAQKKFQLNYHLILDNLQVSKDKSDFIDIFSDAFLLVRNTSSELDEGAQRKLSPKHIEERIKIRLALNILNKLYTNPTSIKVDEALYKLIEHTRKTLESYDKDFEKIVKDGWLAQTLDDTNKLVELLNRGELSKKVLDAYQDRAKNLLIDKRSPVLKKFVSLMMKLGGAFLLGLACMSPFSTKNSWLYTKGSHLFSKPKNDAKRTKEIEDEFRDRMRGIHEAAVSSKSEAFSRSQLVGSEAADEKTDITAPIVGLLSSIAQSVDSKTLQVNQKISIPRLKELIKLTLDKITQCDKEIMETVRDGSLPDVLGAMDLLVGALKQGRQIYDRGIEEAYLGTGKLQDGDPDIIKQWKSFLTVFATSARRPAADDEYEVPSLGRGR